MVVQYPDPPFVAGAQSPLPGASSVPLDTAIAATLSKPAAASSVNLTLTGPGSTNVPGTASYNASTGKVTFTPAAPLDGGGAFFTATLTGTSTTGQALRRRHLDLYHRCPAADGGGLPLHALSGHRDPSRHGIQ